MREAISRSEKLLSGIGHFYFLLFTGLAVYFYQERVLVGDAAFQVFTIIRSGEFGLYSNRYSNFIAQALPVAAVHARLPLNTILILYSIAPILVCYACYCLALYALKDRKAALTIVLAGCIMLTQGFYFATFEVNQAVAVLTLLAALMLRPQPFRIWHWLLLGFGVVLSVLFHPLAIIGVFFAWGFVFLHNPTWGNKRLLWILALGVGVVAIKTLFLTNAYESDKISPAGLFKRIAQLPKLESPGNFLRWLIRDYYLLLLFSALTLTVYIRQKKWLLAGWYVASAGGFWLLMVLANPDAGNADRFYIELHLQILALIAALPFVYDVLPLYFRSAWLPAVLVLLLVSRLMTIYTHRTVFANRLHWYDKLYAYTNRFPETKFIIKEENVPGLKAQNELLWATAYESLLYFASSHRQPQKTIFIAGNTSEIGYLAYTPDKFATTFETFPAADLPAQHFLLKPSNYRFLNTPPAGVLPEVSLKPQVKKLTANEPGEILALPLRIRVAGVLPSGLTGEKAHFLSYRLYQNDREVAANTIRTPLEIDVQGEYEQDLLVEAPQEKGTYLLVPYLLPYTGNQPWGQAPEIELQVK